MWVWEYNEHNAQSHTVISSTIPFLFIKSSSLLVKATLLLSLIPLHPFSSARANSIHMYIILFRKRLQRGELV
jgi:hypothetical protein